MTERPPRQADLFSGKWVDNRTRRQRRVDRQRGTLRQTEMFSQREVALFGVRARPLMDLHPGRLQLITEDPRTPEEREADLTREAQRLMTPMFEPEPAVEQPSVETTKRLTEAATLSDLPALPCRGLRQRQRAAAVHVRRR